MMANDHHQFLHAAAKHARVLRVTKKY